MRYIRVKQCFHLSRDVGTACEIDSARQPTTAYDDQARVLNCQRSQLQRSPVYITWSQTRDGVIWPKDCVEYNLIYQLWPDPGRATHLIRYVPDGLSLMS